MFALLTLALAAVQTPPAPASELPELPELTEAQAQAQAPSSEEKAGDSASVLVLDLAANGVDETSAHLLSSLLTDAVARRSGMKTLSQEDFRRVVALYADREAAGCDTSSCLAELADAMGVDYVVYGDVGKLGSTYLVTTRLFDAGKSDAVARETIQATSIDGLRHRLDAAAGSLLAPIARSGASTSTPAPGLLWPGLAAMAVGGVTAVGLGVWAFSLDGTLRDEDASGGDKNFALEMGPWVLLGAAGAAVVTLAGGGLVGAAFLTPGEP